MRNNHLSAQDFLKTENVITYSPDTPLSKAVGGLESGHDAAFIVDGNKFIGLINPYYTLFKGNYPSDTKVKNCLFHPPKLDRQTPLRKVVQAMLSSKIYYLPVLTGKDELVGIVSIRRLMQSVLNDSVYLEKVAANLKPRTVEKVSKNTSLGQARSLLKKGGVSRLPVIDDRGKLIGLVTRFDIRQALSSPKTSQGSKSREGNKAKANSQPISKYMSGVTITAPHSTPVRVLISKMLDQEIGSILLVDKENRPTGLVSYRDVLEALL